MTVLWTPEESRDQHEPEQVKRFKKSAHGRAVYDRLKNVDARLDLIWIKKGATHFPQDERWAIVRYGDDGLAGCWIVQNDSGGYCEPTDQHIDALIARDTSRSPEVMAAHKRAVENDRAHRIIEKEAIRAEFREKLGERIDHLNNPSMSVPATKAVDAIFHKTSQPKAKD